MGGVCPGGMAKRNAKLGAKLKTIKSLSNQKGDCHSDSDAVDFSKATRKCDSTAKSKSFSGDSNPSTPNRSKSPKPTRSKPSTPTRKGNVRFTTVNLIIVGVFLTNMIC